MTINKTMQALLDRARNDFRGIAVVQNVCGRGSHGGRVNRGSREVDALNQLVKLEMVEIIERHKSVEANRGNSIWIYDTVYRCIHTMPTDADYLAALGACSK
jgi:hypothetical protein